MRTLMAFVFGIVVTVGVAYISDTLYAGTDAAGAVHRPMVNWDVVGHTAQGLTDRLRGAFDTLRGTNT